MQAAAPSNGDFPRFGASQGASGTTSRRDRRAKDEDAIAKPIPLRIGMLSDGEPASPPETASAACSRVPTHEKELDLQGEPSASAATLPAELVVMLEAFRQEGLPQEACDEIGALCSQARARGSNRRDRRRDSRKLRHSHRDPLPPLLN